MPKTCYCNICGKMPAETTTKRLVVDHNHKNSIIRGYLCDLCNSYLYLYEKIKSGIEVVVNSKYITWTRIYLARIEYHLINDTGFLYSDRRKFRKNYTRSIAWSF